MITSLYVRCDDCKKITYVKYGIGNNYPQQCMFYCHNCNNEINVGFKVPNSIFNVDGAIFIDDASIDSNDKSIINTVEVHPEIPIDDSDIPMSIKTVMHMSGLFEKAGNIWKFRKQQDDLIKRIELWGEIQTFSRLIESKSISEIEAITGIKRDEYLKKYELFVNEFIDGAWWDGLRPFSDLYENMLHKKQLNGLFEQIKSDKSKWANKIFRINDIYMENRSEFDPLVLSQKVGNSSLENIKVKASWSKIKNIYGELYETVADMYIIPSVVSNLKAGRNFDEFSTPGFTLEKYMDIDKAGRCLNFEKQSEFKALLVAYHPWLRNGTLHNSCRYDISTNSIRLYVGKAGKKEKIITLSKYMEECNTLYSVFLLFSLKLLKIIVG